MAITPAAGWIVDPNNSNSVIRDPGNMAASSGYAQSQLPPSSPVTTLSSANGQQIVADNANKLGSAETALSGQNPALNALALAMPTDAAKANPEAALANNQLVQSLKATSASPAHVAMVNDINSTVSNGGLSTGQAQGLKDLTSTSDQITAAIAAARLAQEQGDYQSMDKYTAFIDQQQKAYQDQLTKYYSDIAPLRQKYMDSLSPTAREQEISKSIADIRGQADAFNLQTQQDKFNEYQGQTLGFAGGRAAEIDQKASFKRQEFALKEKNLLTELGLEQDMRKAQGEGANTQMGFLQNDFELQSKAQDRIANMEQNVFDRADKLQANGKTALLSIMDGLQGVDPSTLPASAQAQLEAMSVQAGIPYDLVTQALQTQHARQVFDEALKTSTENRLSGTNSGTAGTYKFTATQVNKGAASAGVSSSDFKGLPGDVQNLFINDPDTASSLVDSVTAVSNGSMSVEDAKKDIESANISAQAKQYFESLLGPGNTQVPTETPFETTPLGIGLRTAGGIADPSNWFKAITGFLGI